MRNGSPLPTPSPAGGREAPSYQELRQAVARAGLLKPARAYYAGLAVASVAVLAAGVALALGLSPWPSVLLSALMLTTGRVQLALIGHDAAHGAVFRSRRHNHRAAAICWSLVAGIGWEYWRDRHNRHHGHTNDLTADPDLLPSLLDLLLGRSGLLVTLLSIVLSSLTLRAEGWLYALSGLRGCRRWTELVLLSANALAWVALIAVLGRRGLGLFGLSELLGSLYLTAIVAPNHRGMAQCVGPQLGFVASQVMASRDLVDHPFWNLFYGGLNAQIEHHLFPSMPRPHLSAARPIVRAFCRRHGLPYECLRPAVAYRRVIVAALAVSGTAELEGDNFV